MSPRDGLLNPEIFPKPDDFDPDRWLRPVSDVQKQQMQAAWLPFNKGPRMCLGMKYVVNFLVTSLISASVHESSVFFLVLSISAQISSAHYGGGASHVPLARLTELTT